MSPKTRMLLPLLTIPFVTGFGSVRCYLATDDSELNLADRGKTIENSISFFVSESDHNRLHVKDGVKVSLEDSKTIINGDTISAEEISTRGGTTLLFRRKSYSFNLKTQASFRHGEKNETFSKLYALSLSMDKNYTSNRFGLRNDGKSRTVRSLLFFLRFTYQ